MIHILTKYKYRSIEKKGRHGETTMVSKQTIHYFDKTVPLTLCPVNDGSADTPGIYTNLNPKEYDETLRHCERALITQKLTSCKKFRCISRGFHTRLNTDVSNYAPN